MSKLQVVGSVFLIFVFLTGQDAYATPPTVDILVALTPETIDENPATFVAELQAHMIAVTANSLMVDKIFRIRPYLLAAAYPHGDQGTTDVALDFITDEDDPVLDTARETGDFTAALGVEAYDLVVVLAEGLRKSSDPTKPACGVGSLIYASNLILGSVDGSAPNEKYGIVLSNAPTCRQNMRSLIAHELGHIFGGDHQLPGESSTHETDDNFPEIPTTPLGSPIPDNHPMVHYAENGTELLTTVMAGSLSFPVVPQFSDPNSVLIVDASKSAGDSNANMKRIIELSWYAVAAYRPKPDPKCSITFTNVCDSGITDYVFSAVDHSGVPILDTIFERKIGNNPWSTTGIFEDVINGLCVPTPAPVHKLIKLRATMNTLVGLFQCEADIFINSSQCGTQPEL